MIYSSFFSPVTSLFHNSVLALPKLAAMLLGKIIFYKSKLYVIECKEKVRVERKVKRVGNKIRKRRKKEET